MELAHPLEISTLAEPDLEEQLRAETDLHEATHLGAWIN
jgi:hypothetical protein